MSQVTNYTVENAGGATVRADINNILLAIQSNNSGVSAPSTTYPGMLWLETPASGDYTLKVRDKGNNHWLTVGVVTDPGSDDEMGTRLLQGAASKTHIKRSDGTVLLAENAANVATLDNVTLGSSAVFPAGHVIQVKQAVVLTDEEVTGSATTNNYADIPGMSVSSFVTTGSNKVLITGHFYFGHSAAGHRVWWRFARITNDGTLAPICVGTDVLDPGNSSATGRVTMHSISSTDSSSMSFLDSPGAGTHIYKVQWQAESTGTGYLNRSEATSSGAYDTTTASSLTAMEIKA